MMTDIENPRPKWRKLLIQLGAGLVFGALVGYGAGHLAGGFTKAHGMEDLPLSVEIAALVAVTYIVIAAIVLAGAMSPVTLAGALVRFESCSSVEVPAD